MRATAVQSCALQSNTINPFLAWNKIRNVKVLELSVDLHADRWDDVPFDKRDRSRLAALLYQAKFIHLQRLTGMYDYVGKLVTIPEIGGKVKAAHVRYGTSETIAEELATCCVNLTSIVIPTASLPKHTATFCSTFHCWECLLSISLQPGGSSTAACAIPLLDYVRRAKHLRELSWWVTQEAVDQERGLLVVFESCSQLERVCISFDSGIYMPTGRILKGLATGCRGLRELRISGATLVYSAMRDVLASCTHLETLCAGSIDYPQHLLQAMVRQQSQPSALRVLEVPCSLFQTYQSEELAVRLGEPSIGKFASLPALRSLVVNGDCTESCHLIAARLRDTALFVETLEIATGATMATAVVDALSTLRCPSLRSLTIHYGRWITDRALIELATTHPHLQTLRLHRASFPSDASLEAVAQHCSALRHLELHVERTMGVDGFSDRGVTALLSSCPELRHVELHGCYGCTDAVLDVASYHGGRLERLMLYGRDLRLTGPGVVRLLSGCPRLRRCELSVGRALTGADQLEVKAAAGLRWQGVKLQLL